MAPKEPNCKRPFVYITGPGILQTTSKDIVNSCGYKRQVEALKRLKQKRTKTMTDKIYEMARKQYESMALSDLLHLRLYGSYTPGVIDTIIIDKAEALEELVYGPTDATLEVVKETEGE